MKKKLLVVFCLLSFIGMAQFSVQVITHVGIPAPMPSTFYMSPCYGTCIKVSAQLSGGTAPYTYSWHNSNITTDTLIYCKPISNNEDTILVKVTDAVGQVAYDFHRVLFDYLQPQSICMVTVDSSTGKNLIVWNQSADGTIASYNVYKETTTSGIYSVIKNIPRQSFSTFVDPSSNPSQKAARYKITVVDTCGAESSLYNTGEAKTIHLTINAGIYPAWNLAWDYAEGINIVKFRIWRATGSSKPVLIDSIQSSLTSYTDLNPPSGVLYYVLEALTTANCNPSLKLQAGNSSYSSSFSNITNNSAFVGLMENNLGIDLIVFPNPATSAITIAYSSLIKERVTITLRNNLGQLILKEELENGSGALIKTLDIKELNKGIYLLEIMCGEGKYNRKIVLE